MSFDVCEHKIRMLVIRAGEIIRQARGLPEEKNVTVIYNETAPLLGLQPIHLSSDMANHLPTPEESARANPDSAFVQICPKCGEKAYYLLALCRSCKDAEGGKYKTVFECYKCQHKEKSEEPMVVWLEKLGIDYGTQTKKSLGIKTITDNGLK